MVGGTFSVICAKMIGPRKDRWDEEKAREFFPNNVPFAILGTMILWYG
jgi:ammonia channel protein AmtB